MTSDYPIIITRKHVACKYNPLKSCSHENRHTAAVVSGQKKIDTLA